jgi:hypothetical protein
MIDMQLELGFNRMAAEGRSKRRVSRACWWFDRMHEVVNRTREWKPVTPPRPEQPSLPLAEGKRF